jgi:hypothetical protein
MLESVYNGYESFIMENQDDLSTPNDVVKLLTDDGYFRSYKDALTEGLDADVRFSVHNVLDSQRQMLLQEASNVGASSFASGWVVMSLNSSDF